MGKQHGYTQMRDLELSVDTSAYAADDMIGDAEVQLENILNEGTGIVLQSIAVHDRDSQEAGITLLFFAKEPSNTTFSDNGALDMDDADMVHFVGHVSIESGDYKTLTGSASSVATLKNIGLSMELLNKSLWVVPVCDGTPTWTNAANLIIRLVFWQD